MSKEKIDTLRAEVKAKQIASRSAAAAKDAAVRAAGDDIAVARLENELGRGKAADAPGAAVATAAKKAAADRAAAAAADKAADAKANGGK